MKAAGKSSSGIDFNSSWFPIRRDHDRLAGFVHDDTLLFSDSVFHPLNIQRKDGGKSRPIHLKREGEGFTGLN